MPMLAIFAEEAALALASELAPYAAGEAALAASSVLGAEALMGLGAEALGAGAVGGAEAALAADAMAANAAAGGAGAGAANINAAQVAAQQNAAMQLANPGITGIPDPNFVANPKKGSIHNRGGAVDISLEDSLGVEVNMGTKFDFFGEEASHNYQNLSDEILANRKFLKEIMLQNNFKIFESEWWHYNLNGSNNDAVSNKKWRCEN